MSKLNLKLNEPVQVKNVPGMSGITGRNLGKSAQYADIDFYMVLLDVPLPEHLAINMIESCLERI